MESFEPSMNDLVDIKASIVEALAALNTALDLILGISNNKQVIDRTDKRMAHDNKALDTKTTQETPDETTGEISDNETPDESVDRSTGSEDETGSRGKEDSAESESYGDETLSETHSSIWDRSTIDYSWPADDEDPTDILRKRRWGWEGPDLPGYWGDKSEFDPHGQAGLERINWYFIDTLHGISDVVDDILRAIDELEHWYDKDEPFGPRRPSYPMPPLFVDLEGVNLGREGSVSILQIHLVQTIGDRYISVIYVIDIHVLGSKAFSTPGAKMSGTTLQDILEDQGILKGFWDCRNDSDALFAHFNIALKGVHDLQLMELGTQHSKWPRCFVRKLAKCLSYDLEMTAEEKRAMWDIEDQGHQLYDERHGGSYEVFNRRPLNEAILRYCIQDVYLLPKLWRTYNGRYRMETWRERIEEATLARVKESQSPDYKGDGPHKSKAPPGWDDYHHGHAEWQEYRKTIYWSH